jgi:hypothetical protein
MYYQELLKEIEKVKNKFKDHVLTPIITSENFKIYEFRNKNGDSCYYQRWIFDRGTLIVTGDCYDSIYRWGSEISLESLSKMGIDYFSGKCVADKNGRKQEEYDPHYGERRLKEIATQHIKDSVDYDVEKNCMCCGEDESCEHCDIKLYNISNEDWEKLSEEEQFELITPYIKKELGLEDYELDSLFYFDTEYQAYEFMSETENEFMFGEEYYEYDINRMTWEPIHHYAALQVAYEKFGDKI